MQKLFNQMPCDMFADFSSEKLPPHVPDSFVSAYAARAFVLLLLFTAVCIVFSGLCQLGGQKSSACVVKFSLENSAGVGGIEVSTRELSRIFLEKLFL